MELNRRLFILNCIMNTVCEKITDREKLINVAMQYGKSGNITKSEIETVLDGKVSDILDVK